MSGTARQLDLFGDTPHRGHDDTEGLIDGSDSTGSSASPRKLSFYYFKPDRSGTAIYVHLIRDKSDPERAPRGATPTPFAWRSIDDASPQQWADAIVAHLADGVPRTFNRLALELTTMTADIAFQSTLDEGLWLAVHDRRLVLTLEAPVFFMVA